VVQYLSPRPAHLTKVRAARHLILFIPNMRHLPANCPMLLPPWLRAFPNIGQCMAQYLVVHVPCLPFSPDVDLRCTKELPSCKILRKRPVDDRRIAFAGAVRFALDGVDIALLDMIGLSGQLAVGSLVLLGQALPLVPSVRERLEVRPDGRELRRQLRAEGCRRWIEGVLGAVRRGSRLGGLLGVGSRQDGRGLWWTSRLLSARARGACRREGELGGVVALVGVVAEAGAFRLAWRLVRGIVRVLSVCERDATPESVPNVHVGRHPSYPTRVDRGRRRWTITRVTYSRGKRRPAFWSHARLPGISLGFQALSARPSAPPKGTYRRLSEVEFVH
jgi:hypothetical protein